MVVDRDAASRLGVSPAAIDNTLYDAFGQRQVSTLYKRYNQHYVVLEADPAFLADPDSLDKIYVKSNQRPAGAALGRWPNSSPATPIFPSITRASSRR